MKNTLQILLINNGSGNEKKYHALFNDHSVSAIDFRAIKNINPTIFDLIVLSDGHALNVNQNIEEINLVRSTITPVIGVCYGFQLLCYAYGGKLVPLEHKCYGINTIHTSSNQRVFGPDQQYLVMERHKYGISKMPNNLTCLADSNDGCEIVKIKDRMHFGLQFHPEITQPTNDGRSIVRQLLQYIFR